MGGDVNLPLILRKDIEQVLVNKIRETRITDIVLPETEINIWKRQFI